MDMEYVNFNQLENERETFSSIRKRKKCDDSLVKRENNIFPFQNIMSIAKLNCSEMNVTKLH